MGHKSKKSKSSSSHSSGSSSSPDLFLAARTILSLLRASPSPPRESDLSSTLTRNIRSARVAVPLAKVLLPNWTLLWMLVETAMREEHLAVIVGWLEKVWEMILGARKSRKHKHDYEEVDGGAGYYTDDYGNKYGQGGEAAEYYAEGAGEDYGRHDGYGERYERPRASRGITW